jgi:catechol 2,3-dioxygenase-like lactoylglutathione lyase family enzyme
MTTVATEERPAAAEVSGPPKALTFAHVSMPCRDLTEGKLFYGKVLGGELHVDQPDFASFRLGGVDVGIGTAGCTFLEPGTEYPHFAFFCGPDELAQMRAWLARCGIPTSNLWTRSGVEALMFFRDPSGNMIELYCEKGFKGADQLPRGPARGHGTAVDIDALRYSSWKLP